MDLYHNELEETDGIEIATTYTIIEGNIDDSFEINKSSGAIYVAQELNYEVTSQFTLQVQTVDNSLVDYPTKFISVDIDLFDVNDERPRFIANNGGDPITFSVSENARVGSVIYNFTALDLDDGLNGVVHYSIVDQDSTEKFRINVLSGVLYLNSALDYEQQSCWIVIISATDQAPNQNERLDSKVTAYISVEDENDHYPVFVSNSKISLWDSEPLELTLHSVIAVDKDSNENGRVRYSIINGNEAGYFLLNETSGHLSLVKSLKNADVTGFTLNISASDHGSPPKKSTQILQVILQDTFKSPPQFAERKYEAKIQENSLIGTEVIRITAFRRNQSKHFLYYLNLLTLIDSFL